jgi:hypothetical protein
MSFTLGEVVASALHTLGQGASSRYPAERLLLHANNGLLRLVEIRPEEFYADEWAATTAESVDQSFQTANLVALRAVRLNADVRSLLPFDLGSIGAWNPAWRSDPAGMPRNALISGPTTFMLYPAPESGVQVLIRHVSVPTSYAEGATVPLSRDYLPPLADYVAGYAELADEEHVNSQRAQSLIAAFGAAVRNVEVSSGKPA